MIDTVCEEFQNLFHPLHTFLTRCNHTSQIHDYVCCRQLLRKDSFSNSTQTCRACAAINDLSLLKRISISPNFLQEYYGSVPRLFLEFQQSYRVSTRFLRDANINTLLHLLVHTPPLPFSCQGHQFCPTPLLQHS